MRASSHNFVVSIEEELDALRRRIFDLEEDNVDIKKQLEELDALRRRIFDLEEDIVNIKKQLEEHQPPIKKQRKEVVRFEEIPDTLDYHQLRRLILSYGPARVFVSRTIPRYAEATYKDNGDSDAIIDDAKKLGMKIYYT